MPLRSRLLWLKLSMSSLVQVEADSGEKMEGVEAVEEEELERASSMNASRVGVRGKDVMVALAVGLSGSLFSSSVIVNEKRQKLSKRRDKVALEMYRDDGILPEAMRNYLALLGWAPKGDREIVSVQTLQ